MQTLVERYNERKEDDVLRSEVYEENGRALNQFDMGSPEGVFSRG
jgi:hypothetical protein